MGVPKHNSLLIKLVELLLKGADLNHDPQHLFFLRGVQHEISSLMSQQLTGYTRCLSYYIRRGNTIEFASIACNGRIGKRVGFFCGERKLDDPVKRDFF